MSIATPHARVVELAELGGLTGLPGSVRFVRRTLEPDSDTVIVVVGDVDHEGQWSADREVVCTTSDGRSRLCAPGGVEVDLTPTQQPDGLLGGHGAGQLDLGYLRVHGARLATAAAEAEAAGLPSRALHTEVAAWSRCAAVPTLDRVLRAVEAVARLDGSVAWRLASDLLADSQLHRFRPDFAARARGTVSAAPTGKGRAQRQDDRMSVSGVWRHVPGALDSEWLLLPVTEARPDGSEAPALLLVSAVDVLIEASPLRSGLRGVGDHQVVMQECLVPAGQVIGDLAEPATTSTAVLWPALVAAASTGLASAVVEGVTDLARSKVRSGTSEPMIADPTVSADLSRALVELPALMSALLSRAAAIDEGRADCRRAAAWFSVTARTVVESAVAHANNAFRPVGASALASTSPMQRALRDLMAASRHTATSDHAARAAVSIVLGSDVPSTTGEHR